MISRSKPRFIHKAPKRVLNLRQGQTVYLVLALGKHSFIQKYMVMDRAKTIITTYPYRDDYKGRYDHIIWKTSPRSLKNVKGSTFSLLDCNAIKSNSYNNHRLFTSKRKAESYLKLLLQGTAV